MRFVSSLKELDEWRGGLQDVKYLFEIELWSVPGGAEDVRGFAARMLEEMGCCGGYCTVGRTHFHVAVLVEELEEEDAADVTIAAATRRARPDDVYEFVARIADKAEAVGAWPVVYITVFGDAKTLEKLQRRLADVRSRLFDNRLVLYPTIQQRFDREFYRRLL